MSNKKDEIKFDENNYRIHDNKNKRLINKSLLELGAGRSILLDNDNSIIAGNGVYEQAKELGLNVRVIETDGNELIAVKRTDLKTNDDKRKELAFADNYTSDTSVFDVDLVLSEFKEDVLNDWEFDVLEEYPESTKEEPIKKQGKLSDRFIIPPFSVLDTKQGIWQDRKRYWLSLGIESELGRDATCFDVKNRKNITEFIEKMASISGGVSIFDPVLCELVYQWFNIPNGKILDPFAGGSVRGIVASILGFPYLGNDLRAEQIEANRINAKKVLGDNEIYPTWTTGDSTNIDAISNGYEADLLFSCPPYADLEVYSDDKADISNMPYNEFMKAYNTIIQKSCSILKNDRFAVFVVGDVRDNKGFYLNFVSDTINCFIRSGLMLYNEMILVNMVGNLQMRAGNYMDYRKVGKQHQNVLVFYKGDPKNIKKNYPKIDLSYMQDIGED